MASRRAAHYFACIAFAGVVIWLCSSVFRVNAVTAALVMLLLVLGIATRWGLAEAILTSVACVFGFNYFFLPPVGTLTIADPQNWIALGAFLISAVVASQLSAKAKQRAEEALASRTETERLYRLSRAMLMDETTELVTTALNPIREIFGLSEVAFFDSDSNQVIGSEEGPLSSDRLAESAASNQSFIQGLCA